MVDGLAARRQVISFDNRGVGASSGSAPDTLFIKSAYPAQLPLPP